MAKKTTKRPVGRPKGPESKKVTITAPVVVWDKFFLIRNQNDWSQAELLEQLINFWEGVR